VKPLLLALACLPTPAPGPDVPAMGRDLARWPDADQLAYRLSYVEARLVYLGVRAQWDRVREEGARDEARRLTRARDVWRKLLEAREGWAYGDYRGAEADLAELRRLLGDADYFAGRLPPLPDLDDYAEIR
jgi:hypothetical protein